MCGRVTGTSKGKGGPMHLSDPHSGLMVTTGVVGGGLPIACGLGLASQLRGTDQVTVVNFGDGATSIGAAHEAANLAALWDLPGPLRLPAQPVRGAHPVRRLHPHRAAGPAVRRLRHGRGDRRRQQRARDVRRRRRGGAPRPGGEGPTFLECLTFRLGAHAFGTGTEYIDPEELARAEAAEPVARHRRWLAEERGVSAETLDAVERQAAEAVEVAVAAALAADPPGPEELRLDVFSSPEDLPEGEVAR